MRRPFATSVDLLVRGCRIGDFNLGGVRVRLPGRRELDAFVLWCTYTNPWDGYLIDENAAAIRAG